MTRRNRVDPWGDLHAVASRGLFTGNRGCLVDDQGAVVRHHRGRLWIVCVTEYRGWRHPLDAAGRWTPVFFLDEAVALAAGHRPCGLCRRDAYHSYRQAATGSVDGIPASALDAKLTTERLQRGRGIDRAADRLVWEAEISDLPIGAVIDARGVAKLVLDDRLLTFGFEGWHDPVRRPPRGRVRVITPRTSVAALRNGYQPVLHSSALHTMG